MLKNFRDFLLFSLPMYIASDSYARPVINIPFPNKAEEKIKSIDQSCQGCFQSGIILFGGDDSFLNKEFFKLEGKNFFQGKNPKGYFLTNVLSWKEYYAFASTTKTLLEFNEKMKGMLARIHLVVVDKNFQAMRRLPQSKELEFQISEKAYQTLKKTKSYCEKGQCSPKVILHFNDANSETIRIRPYISHSTLWRNSDDIRTKDVTKKKRRGVMYWGHFGQLVLPI